MGTLQEGICRFCGRPIARVEGVIDVWGHVDSDIHAEIPWEEEIKMMDERGIQPVPEGCLLILKDRKCREKK